MNKPQRWYAIEGDTAYIYDHWAPERSVSVSVIDAKDLNYYRSKFWLRKIGNV